MSQDRFKAFFEAATGNHPYDYQSRLAGGDAGAPCESKLINVPTGLGKTAAVVLAWLWNRIAHPDEAQRARWPRRLVYCLPMRTLVEQTESEVRTWISRLHASASQLELPETVVKDLEWLTTRSPVILMGGEQNDEAKAEWDIYPERPAILIGTQDMLLSRALNRGYGMSRYRWPMHFGLLNNDCLWIMDETQLMGVGVETSAQLDGFRHHKLTPSLRVCSTWWMSATLDHERLRTVDHPKPTDGWPVEQLSKAEQTIGKPSELITAQKKLSQGSLKEAPAPLTLNASTKDYAGLLAKLIKERHQVGTLTLVVVNRVKRAREVFEALTTGKNPFYDRAKVALIHSRFRPVDRERNTKLLFDTGDRIVIATQAVEAGVDVSARLLVTELAPWSSIVQRIGRCNRRGDIPNAEVLWVNIEPKDDKDDLLRPYSETELRATRSALNSLTDASFQTLQQVTVAADQTLRPVIRRRDVLDLFDTTPDICGQDLDVSRYIRDADDNDVQFFWRSVGKAAPADREPPPHRDELCRISIGDAVKFLAKKSRAWRWNPLSAGWEDAKHATPGAVYLVDVESGGYSNATGWTGEPKDKPTPHPPPDGHSTTYAGDQLTFTREWQTLAEHTAIVVGEMKILIAALADDHLFADTLLAATVWHDVGKAHAEFQKALRDGPFQPEDAEAIYAKSKNPPKPYGAARSYRKIRHELGSALAWLLKGPRDAAERDLVAYLIAAHHGKVRLSIRPLPEEQGNPDDIEALFARGIWDGDLLPPIPGTLSQPTTLDLSFTQMGEGQHGPSWLARTVALRDRFGPFVLAFLETLLRAADARGSGKSRLDANPEPGSNVTGGLELREESHAYTASVSLTAAEKSLVADLVEDGLSIQDKFRPEPLYKQTGKGHYASNTVEEIQRAKRDKSNGGNS
jgi:CRISPR-associated endonuclease/helicase Cas3